MDEAKAANWRGCGTVESPTVARLERVEGAISVQQDFQAAKSKNDGFSNLSSERFARCQRKNGIKNVKMIELS